MTTVAAPPAINIDFQSFQEALNYRTECPFCHSKLSYNRGELKTKIDTDDQTKWILLDEAIKGASTIIIIKGNHIEFLNTKSASSDPTIFSETIIPVGFRCEPTNLEHSYTFEFIIQADLVNLKIMAIYLIEETIKVINNKTEDILKNEYGPFAVTHYRNIPNVLKFKSFPLLPINIKNPLETIDKIKLLLNFY